MYSCEITLENESTETAGDSGCLKFYRPLELFRMYSEIKEIDDK